MKAFKLIAVILSCMLTIHGTAQENRVVDSSFNTWWSSVNRYEVHSRWYFSSEIHIRRTNGLKTWQQFLLRPAINFRLNEQVDFAVGYSYILTYPYGKQSISITTPEHNVWEQATLKHAIGKVKFSHRYRFEQRFMGNRITQDDGSLAIESFKFGERFRYRLTASIPLTTSKKWFIKVFDEIWITQDKFMPTGLNQNWAYLGFGYKFNKRGNVQLGFMDQLVKKGDGVHFENNPTLQFAVGYVIGDMNNPIISRNQKVKK